MTKANKGAAKPAAPRKSSVMEHLLVPGAIKVTPEASEGSISLPAQPELLDPYIAVDRSSYLFKSDTSTFSLESQDCLDDREYSEKLQKSGTAHQAAWLPPYVTKEGSQDVRGLFVNVRRANVTFTNVLDRPIRVRGSQRRQSRLKAYVKDQSYSNSARAYVKSFTLQPGKSHTVNVRFGIDGSTGPAFGPFGSDGMVGLHVLDFAVIIPAEHNAGIDVQDKYRVCDCKITVDYHAQQNTLSSVVTRADPFNVRALTGVDEVFSVKPAENYTIETAGLYVDGQDLRNEDQTLFQDERLDEGHYVMTGACMTGLNSRGDKIFGRNVFVDSDGKITVPDIISPGLVCFDDVLKLTAADDRVSILGAILPAITSVIGLLTGGGN